MNQDILGFKKHPTYAPIFWTIILAGIVLLIIAWLTQSNNKPTQNNTIPIFNGSTSTDQRTTNGETIILPTASLITQQPNKNNYPKTTKGDSKPFWTDTENIQVCKVPYYPTRNCYDLDVRLVNDTTAQIHFSNGGYKITNNLTCYGGNGSGDEPKYVFCRSWDTDSQQWDFFPTWVRL